MLSFNSNWLHPYIKQVRAFSMTKAQPLQLHHLPHRPTSPTTMVSSTKEGSTIESSIENKNNNDESYLLSQALNPKAKRVNNDKTKHYDDPLLALLTNNHKQNNPHQSSAPSESSLWYNKMPNNQSLPFDCTGCGKCCQTKGDVYLNQNETNNAAKLLNISNDEFKRKFSSREIKSKVRNDEHWIVLKQKEDSNGLQGCVFLDEETKSCSIYDARPLQCSTYPFWPSIMKSVDAWNGEVVSADCRDDDIDDEVVSDMNDNRVSIENKWTSEGGGCEGMQKISMSTSSKIKMIMIESAGKTSVEGVRVQDALDKLETYTRYKKSFPSS